MLPLTYFALRDRDLLNKDHFDRLRRDYVWFESLHWVRTLGPEIPLPIGGAMVPFGMSSYGDWWCWKIEGSDPDAFPILLAPPDTGDCTYFSPSFNAMLFRLILDFVSNDVFKEEDDREDTTRFTVEEMHLQIRIWRDQFAAFFPATWIEVLDKLTDNHQLKLQLESPHYKYYCLLLPSEQEAIEVSLLQFDRLDEDFEFDRFSVDWYGD